MDTHSVDAGQLQDESDQEGLAVEWRAEKLQDGHRLLPPWLFSTDLVVAAILSLLFCVINAKSIHLFNCKYSDS